MNAEINEILGLLSSNRLTEAIDSLNALCKTDPGAPFPWFLLGAAHGMLGDYERSVNCCREATRLKPDYADAHYNLSQAFIELGRLDEAVSSLQNCLGIEKHNTTALRSLVNLLNRKGDFKAAEHLATSSLGDADPDIEIAAGYVESLLNQQKDDVAASYLKESRVASVRSAKLDAFRALMAFRKQDYATALDYYKNAYLLARDKPDYPVNIALVYLTLGDYSRSRKYFLEALEIQPGNARARSGYLFSLNYYMEDGAAIAGIHRELMAQSLKSNDATAKVPCKSSGKIRIGYISPDFRRHSVAFFIEPVLERHDRKKFEVYCYSLVSQPDETTGRIKEYADHWRDVCGRPPETIRNCIANDCIDILVDLAGHTSHETLPVFVPRAAPVQVTYLGYPNTTGLKTMDYRVTDYWADPPGTVPDECTEMTVRIDKGFLCYRAPDEARNLDIEARPGEAITFGAFNNYSKITQAVIDSWINILKNAPGTSLLVKNKSMGNDEVRGRFTDMFSAAGVDASRLKLLGHIDDRTGHLVTYNDVDISLDTFPYNGTTTTCESLWMGVPVITRQADVHASRVGSSILHQVGLTEFITGTSDEYIECAVNLSQDKEMLQDLRSTLRNRMMNSFLCDEDGFLSELEDIYRGMLSGRMSC